MKRAARRDLRLGFVQNEIVESALTRIVGLYTE